MRAQHVAVRAVAWVLVLLACEARAGEVSLAPLPEAEVQKIFAVAPEKATAAPKKPRKVLVFWRTPGFKHTVIPCTNAAIEVLGRKTGAYQTVMSDDPAVFEPAKLAEFDAVVMNNTCGKNVKVAGRELVREIFLTSEDMAKLTADEQRAAVERDERLKKSFEEFVRGGKGLVGFHGATGAFHSWPAFGEMLGAFFKWHPAPQKARIKLDDPAHPLLAAFGGKGFEMKEETYVVGDPYSRDTVRVLLTLENTDMMSKNPRKDGDYALAWIRKYGQGRTFYCAFSHFDENFLNPALLRFYLDGIQFALGDLEADATPSAKVQTR
jgi:type 1 glutamine amidotransferase